MIYSNNDIILVGRALIVVVKLLEISSHLGLQVNVKKYGGPKTLHISMLFSVDRYTQSANFQNLSDRTTNREIVLHRFIYKCANLQKL
jgi:hypothetical protein